MNARRLLQQYGLYTPDVHASFDRRAHVEDVSDDEWEDDGAAPMHSHPDYGFAHRGKSAPVQVQPPFPRVQSEPLPALHSSPRVEPSRFKSNNPFRRMVDEPAPSDGESFRSGPTWAWRDEPQAENRGPFN